MKPTLHALGQGYHLDNTTPTASQQAAWALLHGEERNLLTFGFQCSLVCSECGAILEMVIDDDCPGGGHVDGLLEVQTRCVFVKPCSCSRNRK